MNRTKLYMLLLSSSVILGGCGNAEREVGAKVNLSMSLVTALTDSNQVAKAMSDFKLKALDPIFYPFTVFKGVYAVNTVAKQKTIISIEREFLISEYRSLRV